MSLIINLAGIILGVITVGAATINVPCGTRVVEQDLNRVEGQVGVIGGQDATRGAYPWMVKMDTNLIGWNLAGTRLSISH